MYLMKRRKLVYAQVFNGRQKLLKLSLQTFFFLWIFKSFISFHTYIHIWSEKVYFAQHVSVAKMARNLTGRKSWWL